MGHSLLPGFPRFHPTLHLTCDTLTPVEMQATLNLPGLEIVGGRPDMAKVVAELKRECRSPRNAVYCCGPQGLMNATIDACVNETDASTSFEVHNEVFAF